MTFLRPTFANQKVPVIRRMAKRKFPLPTAGAALQPKHYTLHLDGSDVFPDLVLACPTHKMNRHPSLFTHSPRTVSFDEGDAPLTPLSQTEPHTPVRTAAEPVQSPPVLRGARGCESDVDDGVKTSTVPLSLLLPELN